MDPAPFLALETEVWESLRSGDFASSAHLIAEDFLGVYPIGIFTGEQRAALLAGLTGPVVGAYELDDARLLVVSDDDVLLCYRARSRGAHTDESAPLETTYISSLWSNRNGTWLNVFSQDTVAN